jgi:hypothetical protein
MPVSNTKDAGGDRWAGYVAPLPLKYASAERSSDLDGAAATVTVPSGADTFEVVAEGGAVRFEINDDATASSAGYVPENTGRVVGPLTNLTSLSVYGASGVYANVIFYQSES